MKLEFGWFSRVKEDGGLIKGDGKKKCWGSRQHSYFLRQKRTQRLVPAAFGILTVRSLW